MNDDRQATDWSDERLDDAFRARAAERPTPVGLATGVRSRIEAAPAHSRGRFFALAGLAAAAAVALAVGISGLAAPPGPAAPSAAAGADSTFGLPIIDVAEGMAVRDIEQSDREIAIRGFLTGPDSVMFCAMDPAPVNPTDLGCNPSMLTAEPHPTTTTGDDTVGGAPRSPTAIHPSRALIEAVGAPAEAPVVLIGHFHDRRAQLCREDRRAACDATFVVDRIDSVDGRQVPSSTIVSLGPPGQRSGDQTQAVPKWSADELDARLVETMPGLEILSRVAISADRIGEIEPALATGGQRGIGAADPILWAVTALSPAGTAGGVPVRHSFVVGDGLDKGYEALSGPDQRFALFSLAPVAAAPSVSATSSASPQASTTWVGDPITVAEAINHRDGDLDDTELAIAGYSWRPAGSVYCPLILPTSPAMAVCPDNLAWISDRDPGPQTGPEFIQPAQPALQLLIRPDTYAQIPLPPQPGRVITMGHFDDHRSADCPADQIDACRRNFIVDAILDPDAPALDRLAIDGRQIEPGMQSSTSPAQVVEGATGIPAGADRILVASRVPGAALVSYEPKAAAIDALSSADAVWLIRYLARTDDLPVVKTILVADRQDLLAGNVFAVTPTGEVVQQPGQSQIVSP